MCPWNTVCPWNTPFCHRKHFNRPMLSCEQHLVFFCIFFSGKPSITKHRKRKGVEWSEQDMYVSNWKNPSNQTDLFGSPTTRTRSWCCELPEKNHNNQGNGRNRIKNFVSLFDVIFCLRMGSWDKLPESWFKLQVPNEQWTSSFRFTTAICQDLWETTFRLHRSEEAAMLISNTNFWGKQHNS